MPRFELHDMMNELRGELDRLDNLSLERDLTEVELGVKYNIEATLDELT